MNVVLKLHLRLLLSIGLYELRAENGLKSFAKLVNMWGQGSFNSNYLNVLRGKDLRRRGRPNIRSGNRKAEIPQQKTTEAGIG